MKKVILAVCLAGALMLSVGAGALAQGKSQEHACLGDAVAAVVPEFVATDPPAFGEFVREQGQTGTRDEYSLAFIETFAPCP